MGVDDLDGVVVRTVASASNGTVEVIVGETRRHKMKRSEFPADTARIVIGRDSIMSVVVSPFGRWQNDITGARVNKDLGDWIDQRILKFEIESTFGAHLEDELVLVGFVVVETFRLLQPGNIAAGVKQTVDEATLQRIMTAALAKSRWAGTKMLGFGSSSFKMVAVSLAAIPVNKEFMTMSYSDVPEYIAEVMDGIGPLTQVRVRNRSDIHMPSDEPIMYQALMDLWIQQFKIDCMSCRPVPYHIGTSLCPLLMEGFPVRHGEFRQE